MGAYQNAIKRLGHKKWFADVFKHIAPHVDRFVSRVSRGRWNVGSTIAPTLILVHTGRKSGREFRTPLTYGTVDGNFILVGSNWGQSHHPAWSSNLLATPAAKVVIDGETLDVRARRVGDEEKAELWKRMVAIWPAYDTYVERSGRDLRVFVLERR